MSEDWPSDGPSLDDDEQRASSLDLIVGDVCPGCGQGGDRIQSWVTVEVDGQRWRMQLFHCWNEHCRVDSFKPYTKDQIREEAGGQ